MEFPCIKYTIWTDWHRFDLQILSSVRKYHTYCIYKYCSCAYLCTVHTFCQIHNVPPTFFPRDGGHNAAFIISHRERERERQWQRDVMSLLPAVAVCLSAAVSPSGSFRKEKDGRRDVRREGGRGGGWTYSFCVPLRMKGKKRGLSLFENLKRANQSRRWGVRRGRKTGKEMGRGILKKKKK